MTGPNPSPLRPDGSPPRADGEPDATTWGEALRRVVADPDDVRIVLQPIVDLQRGVIAGHEVLARPVGPPMVSPDRWFAAAVDAGLSGALSAAVLRTALPLLDALPANTFLTVNLEPDDVSAPEVREVLADRARLDRLVIEVTERSVIDEVSSIHADLTELRARGATVAVDDAGAGYAGLQALLVLRPQVVKLDRSLVSNIDQDPAKRALLSALGEFANGIDAWVLAEGIETVTELEELVRLGVPLGQGYLLGRPVDGFTDQIEASLVDRIQGSMVTSSLDPHIASLVQPASTSIEGQPSEPSTPRDDLITVIVDPSGRPRALRQAGQPDRPPMVAKLSDSLAEVARRAAIRRDGWWHDPVVATDARGNLVGIVSIPRLLEALAVQRETR